MLMCRWIGKWVHTGHLYIDGLKMSKSLKNFVTISSLRDILSELTRPETVGDVFRWWALGMTGPHGTNAH